MKRLFIALSLCATSVSAAQLVIQNSNAAGQGFNDTTPAAPVGLNYGTTKGAQAVIAFQYAAAIWGATLQSVPPVVIDAAFVTQAQDSSMTCNATSGLLGFTSPVNLETGGTLPNPNAAYVVALANAITGKDNTPGQAHIKTRFNAGIGTANCLPSLSWYYGLDTNIPAGQVSLLTTLLHEFSHGLGFASFVNTTTGVLSQSPSTYDFHVFDETRQSNWANYTSSQRMPLLTGVNELAWDGVNVAAGIPTFLARSPVLNFASGGTTATANFLPGQFSGPVPDGGGAQPVAAANPLDACTDLLPNSLTGSLALIERGDCNFYDKAQRAFAAGATGSVIFDNASDAGLVVMASPDGGVFPPPSVFISNTDGNDVLQRLAGGAVTATFGTSQHISNTDTAQSRVLLYTPSTVTSGSTLSHWNAGSFPVSLLMEPFIGPAVRENLDLTPAALADMGWTIVNGLTVGVSKAENAGVDQGGQANYLISIFNRRSTDVASVSLDLVAPSGTKFVSATGSGCTALPCGVGAVKAGEIKAVVVALQAPNPVAYPFAVTAVLTTPNSGGSDNLNATVSSAGQTTSPSSGGGGGCTTGGVPFAMVGVIAIAAAMRARRRKS